MEALSQYARARASAAIASVASKELEAIDELVANDMIGPGARQQRCSGVARARETEIAQPVAGEEAGGVFIPLPVVLLGTFDLRVPDTFIPGRLHLCLGAKPCQTATSLRHAPRLPTVLPSRLRVLRILVGRLKPKLHPPVFRFGCLWLSPGSPWAWLSLHICCSSLRPVAVCGSQLVSCHLSASWQQRPTKFSRLSLSTGTPMSLKHVQHAREPPAWLPDLYTCPAQAAPRHWSRRPPAGLRRRA